MKHRVFPKFLIACLALSVLLTAAQATGVETVGGADYCFTADDFFTSPTPGSGIYLCEVPEAALGALRCGGRTLRTGDVLSADDLARVVFHPASACDATACISYYTIWDDQLSDEAVLTIRLRSGENGAPTANDLALETYKNLEKTGQLDAADPDGDALTFTIVQTPKRGSIALENDGSFRYTPKENKVGRDSFTYTATDPSGAVSNEATVTIDILKPIDKATYADMRGDDHEFEALWLRSTGLMQGAQVTGQLCFYPNEPVSRGDFLVMAMELAGIAPDDGALECAFADAEQTPGWMRPYLCSALRRGIVRGVKGPEGLCFRPDEPVTQAQAAVIVRNLLDLSADAASSVFSADDAVPTWAAPSLDALTQAGVQLPTAPAAALTRRDAACLLYQMSRLM